MDKNLVLGCYMAGVKYPVKSWQEVDEDTRGLVSALTYVVLFINDQVYNHILMLGENLKPSKFYKHKNKMDFNTIDKEIKAYNFRINNIACIQSEVFASITQSMEDDLKHHIDRYYYAVSQVLLNNETTGEANRIASYASTINMLCQVSNLCINDFGKRICDLYRMQNNPLDYLKQEKIEKRSAELSSRMADRATKVNLNEEPSVSMAFMCIMSNMLNPKVFENAFASYHEYE